MLSIREMLTLCCRLPSVAAACPTHHDRMAFTMPEFINLSDADIAEVVNYIRNSWTNQGSTVDVDDVVQMRHFLSKTKNWHRFRA